MYFKKILALQNTSPIRVTMTSPPNAYCWNCAKAGTDQKCSKCIRHYHKSCVENICDTDWICVECKNGGEFEGLNEQFIPKIIYFIFEDNNNQFDSLTEIEFSSEQSINAIDLPKMKRKNYENVAEFEEDIKWFIHNCRTIHAENAAIQEASGSLIGYVKKLIEFIHACPDCFEEGYESFEGSVTTKCSKLHLLVWAKLKGYRYWPARLLAGNSVDTSKKKTIIVRFFGDDTWSALSVKNCFLYSKKVPENRAASTRYAEYYKAIKETNEYIAEIRDKFGRFNYAEHRTAFNPEKLQDHLNEMIAEKPNATTSAEGNSKTDKQRKRPAESTSFGGPAAKNIRTTAEFAKISDLIKDNVVTGFRNLNQSHNACVEQVGDLQRELFKVADEKSELERENEDLKQEQRREKDKFEVKRRAFWQNVFKLKEKIRNEKRKYDFRTEQKRAMEIAHSEEKRNFEAEKKILVGMVTNSKKLNLQLKQASNKEVAIRDQRILELENELCKIDQKHRDDLLDLKSHINVLFN